MGLPNATRCWVRSHMSRSAFSAMPMARMQWWIRPGSEAGLRDREPATLLAEEVLLRDPHVLEERLAVTAARVVPEHRERAHDGDTGRVERHDHHAVAPVPVGIGVRDAHENGEGAAARRRAARPPLVRVDHVVVTVAGDATPDVGGVGARDPRLGHREARPDGAVEQRIAGTAPLATASANLASASMFPVSGAEQLVASWESGDCPMSSHSGAYSRLVRPGTVLVLGEEEVPQPAGLRLRLQLLHDRWVEVRVARRRHLFGVDRFGRIDALGG